MRGVSVNGIGGAKSAVGAGGCVADEAIIYSGRSDKLD